MRNLVLFIENWNYQKLTLFDLLEFGFVKLFMTFRFFCFNNTEYIYQLLPRQYTLNKYMTNYDSAFNLTCMIVMKPLSAVLHSAST